MVMTIMEWLFDSDPAIRWQVLRDLADAPAEEVATERARVATEGWGAELLAAQGADGQSPAPWLKPGACPHPFGSRGPGAGLQGRGDN